MSGERRRRVENGLTAVLQIEGREPERFTVTERMQRYAVPGVAIAVVDDGEIVWSGGYGTRGSGSGTVTADTLFQAASISKAVAAVAVLALVEHGDLDLDTDVNRYLRSWRLPASSHTAEQPVTLRHLLSHTAGLTVPGFPGYPVGQSVPSVPALLSGLPRSNTPAVESFAVPGTVAQYSGGGSTVVQLLVGDVTGREFADVVADLVLRPFGMADSAYQQPLAADRVASAALAHDATGALVPGGFHVYPELQAAGLWSTADDLARWLLGVQRILAGDRGGPISPEMARQMITRVAPGGFGLGPEVMCDGGAAQPTRFGHSGANQGYKSQVDGLIARASGCAIITNGENGTTLVAEIRRAIADEYGHGAIGPAPVRLADVPDVVLQRYVGRYAGPFDRPLSLQFADGELFSPAPYGRRRMLPLGPTTFLDEETGATLEVELEHDRVRRIAVLIEGGVELMAFEPLDTVDAVDDIASVEET